MIDSLRTLIDEHWRRLEQGQASAPGRFRVSELPVETTSGPVAAAVDFDGYRHILVPIDSHQKVRAGLDGPVLVLRKRPLADSETFQTYADLGCMRGDLHDVFTTLCADVLITTGEMPDNPSKALYRVLDRWKALFKRGGAPLGKQQMAGLLGELLVLRRLLGRDGTAHRLWKGPAGEPQDFRGDIGAIETKVSSGREARGVRIHGLEQLDPPSAGELHLAWFRLEETAQRGTSLVELVDQVLRLSDDESTLLDLLSKAGYRMTDADLYRDVRFVVLDERWYVVDAAFPKLTSNDLAAAGIAVTVSDVDYTIDLSKEPPMPLSEGSVEEHLMIMIRGVK